MISHTQLGEEWGQVSPFSLHPASKAATLDEFGSALEKAETLDRTK